MIYGRTLIEIEAVINFFLLITDLLLLTSFDERDLCKKFNCFLKEGNNKFKSLKSNDIAVKLLENVRNNSGKL